MFCVRASGIRRCVPAVLILVMAAATVSIPAPAVVRAATLPELPRVYLDTTVIPPTGRILTVPAGGDVQGALNAAQSGDVVELQAGAAFLGSFSLPRRTGWVTVRSSAWASLPRPGPAPPLLTRPSWPSSTAGEVSSCRVGRMSA